MPQFRASGSPTSCRKSRLTQVRPFSDRLGAPSLPWPRLPDRLIAGLFRRFRQRKPLLANQMDARGKPVYDDSTQSETALNRHDFLFLGGERVIDFADHVVGRLLHVGGHAHMIALADLLFFFQLLQQTGGVAAHIRDATRAASAYLCPIFT